MTSSPLLRHGVWIILSKHPENIFEESDLSELSQGPEKLYQISPQIKIQVTPHLPRK